MTLKLNIAEKGKTWKIEVETTSLAGKSVGDTVQGNSLNHDFDGYELEITGGSDISGFPMSKSVEGLGLKKMMLSKGWGMWTKGKGLRLRKTVRGKVISEKTVQVNTKVLKDGKKKLPEIFPEQNKSKEIAVEAPKIDSAVKSE